MDRKGLAGKLIDCGVVSFKHFAKAAGVRREETALRVHPSMALAYPGTRKVFLDRLEAEVTERCTRLDSFAAVDYDSLPWAAWLADRQEKPLLYLHEALAETGETRHKVEGYFLRNHFVACVESVLDNTVEWVSALKALRRAYCRVPLLLTIVDANPKVNARSFEWLEVPFVSLVSLDEIAEAAVERKLLKAAEAEKLLKGFYKQLKPVPKPEDEKAKRKIQEHGSGHDHEH